MLSSVRLPGIFSRLVSAAACTSLLLGACAGGESPNRDEGRRYLVDRVGGRGETASGASASFTSLAEMLPNVAYQVPGGNAAPVTDLVVVGEVTTVDKGAGFRPVPESVEQRDDGDGIEIDFDDPDAVWKTVEFTVKVSDILSAGADGSEADLPEVRVGLAIDRSDDFELISAGLRDLGMSVFFLLEDSAVFAYDPSLFAVVLDGAMVATVGDDGALSLPFKDPAEAAALLEAVGTLSELEAAAERAPQVIELEQNGGVVERAD